MSMSRSQPAKFLIVGLLLIGLALAAACRGEREAPAGDPRPRAIVLVTVDGLVPGRLALFGGAEAAPELERLAAEGAAWNAWTAAPMTRPGAATYLTGLSPDRHGVRDDRFSTLDTSIPTLGAALHASKSVTTWSGGRTTGSQPVGPTCCGRGSATASNPRSRPLAETRKPLSGNAPVL